jgi:hypothetical protein
MPEVVQTNVPQAASMGIAVEGSTSAWPGATEEPFLPPFDTFSRPRRYFDIFNRGRTPFHFTASASAPWIVLSQSSGDVAKEQRVRISLEWSKVRAGTTTAAIKVSASTGESVTLNLSILDLKTPARDSVQGFVESDGYVSMEADHYTRKVDASSSRWEKIPDYGRTGSAMSVFPVDAASITPPQKGACLEYQMYLFDPSQVELDAILAPSLNFLPGRGLRYAVSFDDQLPQIIDALAKNSIEDWSTSVEDNVRISKSTHVLSGTGYHTLKFCMVDPGIVLEKLVVELRPVRPSYLGPPESYRGLAEDKTK